MGFIAVIKSLLVLNGFLSSCYMCVNFIELVIKNVTAITWDII